jgi:hypothetical protein
MLIHAALAFMAFIGFLSARQLHETWKLWAIGFRSHATVVDVSQDINESNYPVVKFFDVTGKAYTVKIFTGGLIFRIGDNVELTYFPAAPERAKLAEPISFILPALGFIGSIFVGVQLFLRSVQI